MKKWKRLWAALLGALVLAALLPVQALAAAGEDTFLTVWMRGAPRDMSITLHFPEDSGLEPLEMTREDRVWETYFRVYFRGELIKWRRGLPKGTELLVEAEGETRRLSLPEDQFAGENAVFLLDGKTGGLEPGVPAFRTGLLAALRAGVTLLLQALVFWLLRYRDRRSWIIFSLTAAAIQVVLGLFVLRGASTLTSDYVLWALVALCLSEGFLTVVQTVLFSQLLWEHQEKRAVAAALACNGLTLGIGGAVVFFFPM